MLAAAATLLLVIEGNLSLSLVMPGNLLLARGAGLAVLLRADKLKGPLANLEELVCKPAEEEELLLYAAPRLAVDGGGPATVGGVPGLFSAADKLCTGV